MKVVITSMRNEADYILEWVSWNLMIGFDKIIIYTNNNDDDSLILLEKLQKIGVIEYFELNPPEGKQPQMYAFNKGMEWVHEHKPEWVCCLDSDEFLVLKYDSNITDYLSRFNADAIAINWKIFGSGGIEKKGLGLTPERFLLSANAPYREHRQFKSIFRYNPELVRFHHRAIYKNGAEEQIKYIYSDGYELSSDAKKPGFPINESYITFDYAQINHYTIRSKAEFFSKMSRGNGLDPVQVKNKRHEEYLNKFDKASVYDNSALRFLEQHIYHYNNLLKKIDTIG